MMKFKAHSSRSASSSAAYEAGVALPDITEAVLRGGGDSLIKVGTDVWAQALGISGVNFFPALGQIWEVNFARALGFWQFLTKKCVIIDKSEKSDLLAENFQFWHFKSHENLPSH